MAQAPPEMRTWGTVSPAELARMVIVSPHLDDAVLGCSYLLAAHPGVPVVTVFAGRPIEYPDPPGYWDALGGFGPGDEVHVTRRAEDVAALGGYDARPIWLDFVEHSYLERPEWVGPDDVVDTLEATLRDLEPTAVFVPFGLGNPDHACTHDAAMLVRDRMLGDADGGPAWFCYEDALYNYIPGLLAWRVSQLFRKKVWPTPSAPPVDVDHARKLAAIARYATQVPALEAEMGMSAKVERQPPEQYWRLAPPPPGWEALTEM
ncbi:MAG TPA: PIG-L family deacetylase [Acidimicrobiia bacterium]|nr:PIG-L family deacetylase [Acidimicrobiia bacterium]